MTGSTPIDLKMFDAAIKDASVASGAIFDPDPLKAGEADTASGDKTLPANGRRANPLIAFLRFMLSKCLIVEG